MATNIRRSLFIGLGGTGINAILNTKKMYLDSYGEIPKMVGFLGIDTDGGEFDKQIVTLRNGSKVKLRQNEQIKISVQDPFPLYAVNKQYLNWFPQENAGALISMTTGAGQVRSNGRFAEWSNHLNLRMAINNQLNAITQIQNINNPKYGILTGNPVINMVFSICGGTGCGSFLNIAYLIRQHFPGIEINGYAVMPGVFVAMNEMRTINARSNAYGSLEDIDWLMSLTPASESISLENLNDRFSTNINPFDTLKLIDNENANRDCVNHVDHLCAMLGMSLATLAGDTSAGVGSQLNNLKVRMYSKNYDIANKIAWASGIGMCEITVNSNELSSLYSLKAAQFIIDTLLSSTADATTPATGWINDMQIRENNGYDQVIDYMFQGKPKGELPEITNCSSPEGEVNFWLNRVAREADDVKGYPQKVLELSNRVERELDSFVDKHLQENGVKFTGNVLDSIVAQIDACYEEMRNELKKFKEDETKYTGALDSAKAVLANYDHSWYSLSPNRTEEYKNDVASAAFALATSIREAYRREAAINFYSKLKAKLTSMKKMVEDIKTRLEGLWQTFEKDKEDIRRSIESQKPLFQIDLTERYLSQVVVNDNGITSYFLGAHNVMAMATMEKKTLEDIFLNYTSSLDEALRWKAISIDQVYSDLSEQEKTSILKEAVEKSSPMLRYNIQSQGIVPQMPPDDTFVVAVRDHNQTPISIDSFKQFIEDPNERPELCSTGAKDSIIIFRMVGPLPPCVLRDMTIYQEAANKSKWNVHFDAVIQARMQRQGWSIFPSQASSDALELWVKGFIFDLIRNKDGHYQYQDYNEKSKALEDYWVDLDNPKKGDRATAFELFKMRLNDKGMHDTFVNELEKRISNIGQAKYNEKIATIKGKDYYYDNVSQINLKRETLDTVGYDAIKRQIIDEIDYVNKEL